jgi:uncharacterized membrane protein
MILLCGGMLAYGLLSYGQLPERYPTHFNWKGEPDSWSDKSHWHVLLMPLIFAGCVAFSIVAMRYPQSLNFPGRARVAALPPERRASVHAYVRLVLLRTMFLVGATLAVVQHMIVRSAKTGDVGMTWLFVLVMCVLCVVPTLGLIIGIHGLIRRAEADAAEDE